MVRLLLLAAVCVAVAVAVPARPQADPPPGPDVCTFDTKDACDAVPCCTWCGSKWSPTVSTPPPPNSLAWPPWRRNMTHFRGCVRAGSCTHVGTRRGGLCGAGPRARARARALCCVHTGECSLLRPLEAVLDASTSHSLVPALWHAWTVTSPGSPVRADACAQCSGHVYERVRRARLCFDARACTTRPCAGMVLKGGVMGQELHQVGHHLPDEHEPNAMLRHKHVHVDAAGLKGARSVHGPGAA